MEKRKIYVASSWRNKDQPMMVAFLRHKGFNVYDFKCSEGFSWDQIDPEWKSWTVKQYKEGLVHSLSVRGYMRDYEAMETSDICILVLPSGRSAHTEAGWMKGMGKKVFVYMPTMEEPELMYKIYNGIFTDMDDLYKAIK